MATDAKRGRTGPRARRERMLRATVRRYGACLGQLPALERRVLVLRAALGRPQARSRTRVAVLASTTVHRVALAERRGLHRLRALGHRGGCAILAPATMVFASTAMMRSPLPALSALGAPAARTPVSGVKAEHGSRRATHTPAGVLPLAGSTPVVVSQKPGGRSDIAVVFIPLLLVAFAAYAVRSERRRRV